MKFLMNIGATHRQPTGTRKTLNLLPNVPQPEKTRKSGDPDSAEESPFIWFNRVCTETLWNTVTAHYLSVRSQVLSL